MNNNDLHSRPIKSGSIMKMLRTNIILISRSQNDNVFRNFNFRTLNLPDINQANLSKKS